MASHEGFKFTRTLGDYFRFFIMAEVGNLDTCLGGYFSMFIMTEVGNLIEMIINLMTIMIRVVQMDGQMFFIFVRIFRTSLFS